MLHLAPTNSFREKLFLQEDTIASDILWFPSDTPQSNICPIVE
jgi:hypothetical protein